MGKSIKDSIIVGKIRKNKGRGIVEGKGRIWKNIIGVLWSTVSRI